MLPWSRRSPEEGAAVTSFEPRRGLLSRCGRALVHPALAALSLLGPAPSVAHADPSSQPAATGPAPSPAASLTARTELSPERRALAVVTGQERWVDAEEAVEQGFTLVDLGDDWTPYIFTAATASDGTTQTPRYRAIFLGLANDKGDGDGQPLPPGEHNYLEVFGVPPTLSVLRARFLADAPTATACQTVDLAKIRAVTSVPRYEPAQEKKEAAKLASLERQLEKARLAAKAADLDALAQAQPKLADEVKAVAKAHAQQEAFLEVEKRLACEGLYPKGKSAPKHAPGKFDDAMRDALWKFQLKNKLYDSSALRPDTMAALGRSPLENDHAALVRVMTERAVAAANVLEDGSAPNEHGERGQPPTFVGANGEKQPLRDMVSEVTRASLEQLGIDTPEGALAFFQRHAAGDFSSLRAAIKLPPLPEYYAPHMDLSVEIDRGDVIYDSPDTPGLPSRRHFPSFTLRVRYQGQTIPLVRWRTTIGGWRLDQAPNGFEYWRYKGSDIGPRIWRNVVSGPVWIAPVSTPIRSLVKRKLVNGADMAVVNYDELGPGYLSAYGLVAAYNVTPGRDGHPDGDNGVRVHGSSEYRSIRNPEGYSHGCHRLMNHLAVRLFDFVLQHRTKAIEGEKKLGFARQFLWKEDVYEMRLPTRGFWYVLDPPMPVNVLEGNILGKVKKPITVYVPKKGVQYPPGPPPAPPDTPEGRGAGGED